MAAKLTAMKNARDVPLWAWILIAMAIMGAAAGVERGMGRRVLSQSGRVLPWVNETNSAETSQQLADWYSLTHITHGIVLYGLIWLAGRLGRRKWSFGFCLMLAVLAEASWEVLENSPFIINRYREGTMANGYYGDSILNSMSDILFCVGGVLWAKYMPAWVTVLLVAGMEVGLALAIRDNLTLNIIMLIHPFDGIKHWQMGG